MKKILCLFALIALLAGLALGEGAVSDEISLPLPDELIPLSGDELAGYSAATQSDFPDAARIVLSAASEDRSLALVVLAQESKLDAVSAAKQAAKMILGSDEVVVEGEYAALPCGSFLCAVGELSFELYYFSNGETLYIVGMSGFDKAAAETVLNGISF